MRFTLKTLLIFVVVAAAALAAFRHWYLGGLRYSIEGRVQTNWTVEELNSESEQKRLERLNIPELPENAASTSGLVRGGEGVRVSLGGQGSIGFDRGSSKLTLDYVSFHIASTYWNRGEMVDRVERAMHAFAKRNPDIVTFDSEVEVTTQHGRSGQWTRVEKYNLRLDGRPTPSSRFTDAATE